ncbi:hypothetical protein H9P43_001698 [Blastocladiella emersonii ATCC 22665]|nr:hypothetical protein H9P43_001698 [Blastocladiella emersonii ATCC 22665]
MRTIGTWNEVKQTWSWEIRVSVPLPPATDLPSVFEYMAQQSAIADWGINPTSLEDVFVRVSTKHYS